MGILTGRLLQFRTCDLYVPCFPFSDGYKTSAFKRYISWLHLSTPVLEVGVWYLSVIFLTLYFGVLILRMLIFTMFWVIGFLARQWWVGWNGEKRGETRRWWRTTSFVSWPDSNFSEAFGKGKDPKVKPHHSWFWLVKLTWTSRIHIL